MVLLIGGHQRSGTSLLRDLCNGHPDITVTHEFGNFMALGKSYREYKHQMLRAWWQKGQKGILRYNVFRSPKTYKRHVRWPQALQGHAFTARYLLQMRRYQHQLIGVPAIETTLRSIFPEARIVGDKWPDYVFLLDKLADVDGLLFLIIYRDCRDVASSHIKLARTTWRNEEWIKNSDTAEKIAKRWVLAVEEMERHMDKICAIRYEDLVKQPKRELGRLGKWLGVNPAGFPEGLAVDVSIGKHRSELSDEELRKIMEVAGPTMRRLGYL